jgi:hypothetical protein
MAIFRADGKDTYTHDLSLFMPTLSQGHVSILSKYEIKYRTDYVYTICDYYELITKVFLCCREEVIIDLWNRESAMRKIELQLAFLKCACRYSNYQMFDCIIFLNPWRVNSMLFKHNQNILLHLIAEREDDNVELMDKLIKCSTNVPTDSEIVGAISKAINCHNYETSKYLIHFLNKIYPNCYHWLHFKKCNIWKIDDAEILNYLITTGIIKELDINSGLDILMKIKSNHDISKIIDCIENNIDCGIIKLSELKLHAFTLLKQNNRPEK